MGGGMRPNTATSRSLLAFASTTLSNCLLEPVGSDMQVGALLDWLLPDSRCLNISIISQ